MKKVSIILSVLVISVVACKKKDADPTLVAKWNVQSIEDKVSVTGQAPQTTTQAGAPGDYIDFRSDGKVYTQFQGQKDTSSYQINGSQVVIDDSETLQIKNLTNSSVQLYESIVQTGYTTEVTFNLTK